MIVLDLNIVTVALPHIQRALGFSGPNLEWVINAYAVAFGGLLLLGGRSGDLLERRRVFIAGLLVAGPSLVVIWRAWMSRSLVQGSLSFPSSGVWLCRGRAGAGRDAPTS
jgi:MFS family permease